MLFRSYTLPLHFDRVFSSGLSGKMSGDPIVYGGLVFAWLDGLASRDIETVLTRDQIADIDRRIGGPREVPS